MPTLKYYDPGTSTWEEVSSAGAQGPVGPIGPTGPEGAAATVLISDDPGNIVVASPNDGGAFVPDQVFVSSATPPVTTDSLWVDEASNPEGGGGGGTGADEVVIGSGAPTDAAIELWVDLDDDTGTGGGGGAVGPKVWSGRVSTKLDGTFDEPMTGATFTDKPFFYATVTTANDTLHAVVTMDPTSCSTTNVGGRVSYWDGATWRIAGVGWAVEVLAVESGASLASLATPQAKPEESGADTSEMVEILHEALMSMPSGKKALAAVLAARKA